MSKTRLQLNKETILILITAFLVGVLVLANVVILVPALSKIFLFQTRPRNEQLIDTQTVDKAVDLLIQQ